MLLLRLLVLLVLCVDAVAARLCELTGENAPEVVTVMASKIDPDNQLWIVRPNCEVDVTILGASPSFTSQRSDIERVDSIPTKTNTFSLPLAPLSRGADFSKAPNLHDLKIKRFADVVLPSALITLDVSGSSLTSISGVKFPEKLLSLDLSSTQLTSLQGVILPNGISELVLSNTKITAIDFKLPSQLRELDLSSSPLKSLKGVVFPPLVSFLYLEHTALTAIDFTTYPARLSGLVLDYSTISKIERITIPDQITFMWLDGNPISNFEVRRSDLAVLKKTTFTGEVIQPKCADSTAEIVIVGGKQICVISDARFEAVYINGNGVTPDAPSNPETTLNPTTSQGTGSMPSTSDASQVIDSGESTPNSDSSDGSGDPAKSSIKGNSTAPGVASAPSGSSNGAESGSYYPADPSQPRSSRKGGSNSSTTNTVSTSSSGSTAIFVGVGGGGAAFFGVICLWGCVVKRRRRRDAHIETKYNSLDTPQDSTRFDVPTAPFESYLANDVRNDKALIPFRIEQSDLQLGERIAQNISTAVYKSTFQDGDVAVKQLLPGAWKRTAELVQFMDEIRTCASMEHRKIVVFVGISWSGIRDLAVIMELMPLGDLSTLLQDQHDLPTAQDWSRPWTSMQIKSKTSIAQDVAEAVVYLHSFNSPILHRNLKARNVLLDKEGNAKLSGFGISRESSLDDTMTGEIGTTAWVAPEVLRGERYDEKADIYSLGVLMVEIDRCAHPYASEPALGKVNDGQQPAAPTQRVVRHVAYKNTQIAILVSTGKLRPSVTNECPESVASIVHECLKFDASSRPTSMEVFYRLRQARNAFKQQEYAA